VDPVPDPLLLRKSGRVGNMYLTQIVFFRDCNECPGCDNLENTLEDVFIEYAIKNITFKHWIFIDKYQLVTTVKTTEEFIE
jgi:protein-disulfide isomerase